MKVSVWMTTYNHEKYISQCLDSILSQKTNFEFEIILGEDCSTDRTREIVIEYRNKFPDKIKLFLPEKNMGAMQIDQPTWKMCSGDYLALMNGDDFWTDENKLQIQADLLDNDPDTVMCFHKALILNETNGTSEETVYLEPTDILPAESLLNGYNPVQTSTVMHRNIVEVPEWYPELPYGDMFFYLMLSQKGKIKYTDRLMSVYRIHSEGHWQGDSVQKNLLKDLKFYDKMNKLLDYRYDHLVKKIYAQRYFDLIICYIKQNRYDEAKNYFEMLDQIDRQFSEDNKTDISNLKKIIFENTDPGLFPDLLDRGVKWKVN